MGLKDQATKYRMVSPGNRTSPSVTWGLCKGHLTDITEGALKALLACGIPKGLEALGQELEKDQKRLSYYKPQDYIIWISKWC